MRPKSNASSTMGKKKSVVDTIAVSLLIWYTAASSLLSLPTRSEAKDFFSGVCKICCNTEGAILHPQPPPFENWVSLISSCMPSKLRGCEKRRQTSDDRRRTQLPGLC